MAIIFNVNHTTGVIEYFDFDQITGEAYIRREQDVDRFLGSTAEARATKSADKYLFEKDKEFSCYASIPVTVELELLKKGINIHSTDKAMQKRMFEEIERNYPHCKVTEKRHIPK